MRTNFNVSLLNCKKHYTTVAADYCDRSRRKTKLQDNTQRQQREKNTTEILPFYLKTKQQKRRKKQQNRIQVEMIPTFTPPYLSSAKINLYICLYLKNHQNQLTFRKKGPKLKSRQWSAQ